MNYDEASALAKAILESAPKAARKNAKTGFEMMMFDFYTTAIECIEKQIPKKPIEDAEHIGWLIWICPICGKEVGRVLEPLQHHCECGQAIDWGEVE